MGSFQAVYRKNGWNQNSGVPSIFAMLEKNQRLWHSSNSEYLLAFAVLTDRCDHSFTLPRVRPCTKYFCRKGYTTMIGSTVATTAVA